MRVSPLKCCEICGCPIGRRSGKCPRLAHHKIDPTETEILAMCRELREKRKTKPEPDRPVEMPFVTASDLAAAWRGW